jgi:hypothetical protein
VFNIDNLLRPAASTLRLVQHAYVEVSPATHGARVANGLEGTGAAVEVSARARFIEKLRKEKEAILDGWHYRISKERFLNRFPTQKTAVK